MILSIITINYNNLKGLQRTVNSVLNQSQFDKIEYIIVDGGSKDGTYEYLSSLPKSVKWVSEKDEGISDAFNKGIQYSTGDALLCLNSGDYFENNNVIEKMIYDWTRLNVDILSYRVIVSNGVYIPATTNEDIIYDKCTQPHQGTLVSKRLYDIVGEYSKEYKIRMDYHFFARCRKIGASFKFINENVVLYEEGGTSMKLENRLQFWREGLSVKLIYGLKIGCKDLIKFILFRNS